LENFGSCLTCFLRLGSHTGRLESNSASHSALSSAALSASLFFVFKHKLDRVGDSNSISIVCYARCLRSNSCFPLPSNNRSGAQINVFARIFDHRKNKRSAAFIRTPRVSCLSKVNYISPCISAHSIFQLMMKCQTLKKKRNIYTLRQPNQLKSELQKTCMCTLWVFYTITVD